LWYPKKAAGKITELEKREKNFDKNFSYVKAVGWQV
jgi:hypothetical protein